MTKVPEFPYPVQPEPSVFSVLDKIHGCMVAWRDVLRRAQISELAEEFSGLDLEQKLDLDRRMLRIRPEFRTQVQSMGQDVRPYRIWERFRETYDPHPALTRALVDMKSDARISGNVFRRLPHLNPLFLLRGAPPITLPDGYRGRVVAFFITGAVSKRRQLPEDDVRLGEDAPGNASILLDTHDANVNAYHVTAVSEVHNEDGTLVNDLDWCHLTIPVKGVFTLDELARVTADDGFNWEIARDAGEDQRYAYLLGVARIVVSHLLYACSRTVEVDDKPRASRPPVKRKKGEPKPPAAARVRRMGWRLGSVIADSVRRASASARGAGTGASRAPHMRAPHLHTYLVGPGRQEIDIKWLDPIPVNMDKDDGTTITRHPMR
jgi:hypothetical protein